MGAGAVSHGIIGLLGPVLLVPVLALGACQSAAPAVEAVAPLPAPPPKPARAAARAGRPKAGCLTATRKQELFRQFAAMQDADMPDTALAAETASPPAPACKPAER